MGVEEERRSVDGPTILQKLSMGARWYFYLDSFFVCFFQKHENPSRYILLEAGSACTHFPDDLRRDLKIFKPGATCLSVLSITPCIRFVTVLHQGCHPASTLMDFGDVFLQDSGNWVLRHWIFNKRHRCVSMHCGRARAGRYVSSRPDIVGESSRKSCVIYCVRL